MSAVHRGTVAFAISERRYRAGMSKISTGSTRVGLDLPFKTRIWCDELGHGFMVQMISPPRRRAGVVDCALGKLEWIQSSCGAVNPELFFRANQREQGTSRSCTPKPPINGHGSDGSDVDFQHPLIPASDPTPNWVQDFLQGKEIRKSLEFTPTHSLPHTARTWVHT